MKFKNSQTIISLITIILLSFFSIKFLFVNGFFPMHDNTQVARVFEMKNSLSEGIFPVRWSQDLGYGYGYPIFNFYAPFSYYVGGFTNLIINDSLLATKIMIAIGILLAGVFMYFLGREFWGNLGGILSGVLYIYAPYHALNVYVRGAIAETFGYAFIPLAFYGCFKAWKEQKWVDVIIGSLGVAGIILSHNLTAMMTTPFIILLILVLSFISLSSKKPSALRPLLFAFTIALLISAFYWLPSLAEMKYTNVASQIGGGADFKDHFVCPEQLWESTWGFGGSVPGCIDGLSFRLGKIHILLTLITILGMIFIHKNKKQRSGTLFAVIIFAFSIFLMTHYSEFIWNSFPAMSYFQYPWRFLILATAATSFISGGVIWILNNQKLIVFDKRINVTFGCIFLVTIIFFYSKLFLPQLVLPVTNKEVTTKEFINWNISKISDEYLPKGFVVPKSSPQVPKEKIIVSGGYVRIIESRSQSLKAKIILPEATQVHVNTAFFPAWIAKNNDQEIQLVRSNTGFDITLPKGENILTLSFQETPLERFANLLSIAGICLLVLGIIMKGKLIPLK